MMTLPAKQKADSAQGAKRKTAKRSAGGTFQTHDKAKKPRHVANPDSNSIRHVANPRPSAPTAGKERRAKLIENLLYEDVFDFDGDERAWLDERYF